jgi:hypothetical protein
MLKSIFAVSFAVTALLGAQADAAGWKTFTDHAKKCQAQVPASWVPGEYNIGMRDPAGDGSVIVSNSSGDLASTKQIAASTYTVSKTIQDSPARYWMEYADRMGKHDTHWYEALPVGGYLCIMDLTFDSHLSDADAKTVAGSLKKN